MTNKDHVWVIDDDRSIRWVLEKALSKADMQVTCFSSAERVMSSLKQGQPDAIVSDIRMPGVDGIELLERIKAKYADLPVIIMTAHSDLDSAVSAYNSGAFEYLPKPFDMTEAVEKVQRACRLSQETQSQSSKEPGLGADIVGEAPAMQEVFRAIGRLARSNITVLINGASGTGKELVAHALHKHSPRADKSFIALNMAAIPHDLLESELFGHEKGAFTGAQTRREGRFEQANGGTLFLDEIGDMPAETQTRLLRVLSDGAFYRVGGHQSVSVDVRIIAATHQNLEQLVSEGRFREDLFHRLNVIRVHVPSLHQRKEDIPLLMNHFLLRAAQDLSVEPKTILPETAEALKEFEWRGNVRQLENTARWLTVMGAGRDIHPEDLPPELYEKTNATLGEGNQDWQQGVRDWTRKQLDAGNSGVAIDAVNILESILIDEALKFSGGRKQEAAQLLGWGRNTLTRKLKDLSEE